MTVARYRAAFERLRFGVLALLAILVAAPGVHLFELWLAPSAAFYLSHGLPLGLLVVVIWRWRASRPAG